MYGGLETAEFCMSVVPKVMMLDQQMSKFKTSTIETLDIIDFSTCLFLSLLLLHSISKNISTENQKMESPVLQDPSRHDPGIAGVAFASGYEHLMMLRLAVGLGVASTFTSAGGEAALKG